MKKKINKMEIRETTEHGRIIRDIEDFGIIEYLEENTLPVDFPFDELRTHTSTPSDIEWALSSGDVHIPPTYISKAIEDGHIGPECLMNMNLKHIVLNGREFVEIYKEHLDQKKLFLYQIASDNTDNTQLVHTVEYLDENNLWELLSTTALPVEFIREHQDKLYWEHVSIVNHFTEEEVEEFRDRLTFDPYEKNTLEQENNISISDSKNRITISTPKNTVTVETYHSEVKVTTKKREGDAPFIPGYPNVTEMIMADGIRITENDYEYSVITQKSIEQETN